MNQVTETNPVEQQKTDPTQVVNSQNTIPVDLKKEEKPIEKEAQASSSEFQERNWKQFREQRESDRKRILEEETKRKQKEEEAAAFKSALDAILNKPQAQPNQEYENEETEEQKIDRKVAEALSKRDKEYEIRRKQEEMQELPRRLNQEYKDFQEICSANNLDYLDYHYPEVAKALEHMPEGYEKWSTIYKTVKRFIPNPVSNKDEAKAMKNLNKPQSMSAPGPTQSNQNANPFKLDEQRKAENWQRMQKILKGLN